VIISRSVFLGMRNLSDKCYTELETHIVTAVIKTMWRNMAEPDRHKRHNNITH